MSTSTLPNSNQGRSSTLNLRRNAIRLLSVVLTRFLCPALILLVLNSHVFGSSTGFTLQVGPDKPLRTPSAAANIARDGDTVEIEAGVYENDYAQWTRNNLTIRAIGGMAHMQSAGMIPNGKAIWIVSGNNIVIENIEFSGAAVEDTNGAGIRHEAGRLLLRNTFFHDNEFSVLTGQDDDSTLDIESSRLWFQKRSNTFSHGIYVGALKRFTITGSHIKGTDRGHQIKSRALENHILYNRIEDTPNGNSSRLIDLPNCGLSVVMGNDLHQSSSTENVDAIGYGAEDCDGREGKLRQLYVVNNTFVNEALSGTLVKNYNGGDTLVSNNLIMGRGFFLLGEGVKKNNIRSSIARRQRGSWNAPVRSKAIDAAIPLLPVDDVLLFPTQEFSLPVGTKERAVSGPLDIGSREFTPRP